MKFTKSPRTVPQTAETLNKFSNSLLNVKSSSMFMYVPVFFDSVVFFVPVFNNNIPTKHKTG